MMSEIFFVDIVSKQFWAVLSTFRSIGYFSGYFNTMEKIAFCFPGEFGVIGVREHNFAVFMENVWVWYNGEKNYF